MPVEITAADEIARCIIFDRAFEEDVHVDGVLWIFESSDDEGIYHESAVLRRFAPLSEDVHKAGCKIAAKQNARKSEQYAKRGKAVPDTARRFYCGYRSASYASLPKAGDGYLIEITHSPEDGEEAHVDVALTVTVEGRNARATRRTNAGLALADHFGRPEAHRCPCDADDNYHPFSRWGEKCLFVGLRDAWPDLHIPGIVQETAAPGGDDISFLT